VTARRSWREPDGPPAPYAVRKLLVYDRLPRRERDRQKYSEGDPELNPQRRSVVTGEAPGVFQQRRRGRWA
jgi:hypothetical protein